MNAPLVAIVGPTASGKSRAALALALAHGGEIVSCDSLQVYRGFDIGSAKPSREERQRVPHHLLDVVSPGEDFSAADYARLARAALSDIAARGRLAVVAGGTGLYLRALLEGLFEGPSRDASFRARLEGLAERRSDVRLHRLLSRVDPVAAARIKPRDRVRVVRALEVFRATREALSHHHARGSEPLRGFDVRILGIDPGRDVLRLLVEQRTSRMLEAGLLGEVEALLARGYGPDCRPLRAIGYRQMVEVALGRAGLDEARRDIVAETMRYAKRQRTWFRHQAEVSWWRDAPEAVRAAEAWIREGRGPCAPS